MTGPDTPPDPAKPEVVPTPPPKAYRTACYHARRGLAERFGQRVRLLVSGRRGAKPRNVLIEFPDGHRAVTSMGCLRWKCDKHSEK